MQAYMNTVRNSRYIIALLAFLLASCSLVAQSSETYAMSLSTTGNTYQVPAVGLQIKSDGVGGTYSKGQDFVITITNSDNPCPSPYVLTLSFSQFNVNAADTLFVFDGPSTGSPLLLMANNSLNSLSGERNIIYASPNNSSHALTLRFKTANHSGPETGFFCSVECREACEISVPHIDDSYERLRGGIPYVSEHIRVIDGRRTITVCAGDGIRLHGRADYTSYTGHYAPADASSQFTWTLDDTAEVSSGIGLTAKEYAVFDTLDCHEVLLTLMDERGCASTSMDGVRILVATNPIRTISNLGTVCAGSELPVLVSYEANAILRLDTAVISNIHSHTNYVKTFIPDGPHCSTRCYQAPVTFNEFPQGRTVVSKDDICSICVNFEHSYMGDYDLNIICPSGRKATLKYYCQSNCASGHGGGSTFTGYPYGGNNHDSWDGQSSGRYCDSAYNMYGVGLDYCFSRNGDYTLVDGRPANTTVNGSHYLSSSGYTISVSPTFDPRPAAFQRSGSRDAGYQGSFSTKKPSDYANKSDYYKPADDFTSLVGCPLNGVWKIELCDKWSIDNGWVFGWSMDICSVQQDDDCIYGVGIDSVSWDIYPERGTVNPISVRKDAANPMQYYMSAGDTSGRYYARINVTDQFGCHWDSTGFFTILQRPSVSLGNDIFSCTTASPTLDATVSLTDNIGGAISYQWSTGQNVPVITPSVGSTTTYTVSVINSPLNGDTARCIARDTIRVVLGIVPTARFMLQNVAAVYCEPFEAQFLNLSTNTSVYQWDFGDGNTSSEVNPTHVFAAGTYAISLNAATSDGCSDASDIMYLTVGSPSTATVRDTVVENALPHHFAALTFTDSQRDTTIIRTNAVGCDSAISYSLHVYHNVDTTLDSTICETSLPLSWNGVTFTEEASAHVVYNNQYGADSTVYMNVHVLRASESTVRDTVVENTLPYSFAGLSFRDRQTDTLIVRTNSVGCDSNIHFSLFVYYNDTVFIDSVLCENYLPMEWNHVTFFGPGPGSASFYNRYGADSTVMMTLRVLRNSRFTLHDSIVENDLPYLFAGQTFTADQPDTTIIIPNAVGCDSINAFSLLVHRNVAVSIDSSLCDYSLPLLWNGVNFTSDSTCTVVLANRWGTDSLVTMRLEVRRSSVAPISLIEVCSQYRWPVDGAVYTRTGVYSDTVLNSVGCDSVQILSLTVLPPTRLVVSPDTAIATCGHATLSARGGDAYLWMPAATLSDSATLDTVSTVVASPLTSQVYTVSTFRLGRECVVNGNFSMGNTGFSTDLAYVGSIGASYGQYTLAYDASLRSQNRFFGRDHTSPSNPQGMFMICDGSLVADATTWGQQVTVVPHTDYLVSFWATSLTDHNEALLQLDVNGDAMGTVLALGDSISPDGVWRRYVSVWNSGNSTHADFRITNQNTLRSGNDYGIDDISVRAILCSDSRLVSVAVVVDTALDESCDSYQWSIGHNRMLDASGSYVDTIPASNGCDSTIALRLTLHHSTTTYLDTTECDSLLWNLSQRTYFVSSQDSVMLSTIYSCDSNVVMRMNIRSSSPVDIQRDTICDRYVWHYDSTSYIHDTTVVRHASNSVQCDSTTILHLVVHHRSFHNENYRACDTFVWPATGRTYYVTEKTIDTLSDAHGCDSIVTLLVSIYYSDSTILFDTICSNHQRPFGGQMLYETGSYSEQWRNTDDCDSIVVLNLQVNPAYELHVYDTVKQEQMPYLGPDGSLFTNPVVDERMMLYTIEAQCDSLIHFNLFIKYKILDCDERLLFPNLVTPNGDGVNDIFSVVGIDNDCWLHSELLIYNRWGTLIYSATDLKTSSDGWDPSNVPSGTYYFRFQASNAYRTMERKGVIEVVK